ncbi:protein kinase [Leishmania donovani]|uniref:non-specific serine/threonine protein kinase n=1 Tax=Leishmania donovani TaxID=5661 RepID=A0A6J8FHI0_LEIDO|nr:protein kinase [Leishmania donovani]VDZ47194.1 protein_kinase_putative/GeneDB:LmjF.31.1530 [Leishmania donovani]
MLRSGALCKALSSPASRPEASATVSSRGSAADHSIPVSAPVFIDAFEDLTTAKPSLHREPHISSSKSPNELERRRRCYHGTQPCEQVLFTPPVRETVISEEEELSLLHARRMCSSDAQLGTTQAACAWRPASPEFTDLVPFLASQSPLEPLCSSEPAAVAPLSLNATRRASPRDATTDTAAAPTTSGDSSKITMATVSSLTVHTDSNTGRALHSRTSSLLYYSPHIHYDGNSESLETEAALHSSHAAISSSISCFHASSLVTPRALPSYPLSSSSRNSMALTKLQAESSRSEGNRSSSPTGTCGGAACIISDALALTHEKPDHLLLRALASEEGAYVPPLSTFTTTQCTIPPITAPQAEKQNVNTKSGFAPSVPSIRLPVAYSIPVSDSERSLASIPALGYGPRSTPNACSLTSARSGPSARSARHSNRCTSTLRNGVLTLKELFPTLPDELYLTRDRLCISHDSKRRLGSGAYGIVQQAELYPPGVEAPRMFTPTSESAASTSIPSTPCFSPANGRVSIHSFSSIAAAVGNHENVAGASNGGYFGAEQTGRPGAMALAAKTSGNIHFRTVSMFSSDSVTASALPLHQQPYNGQTASFYNGVDDMVRWSSAVESVKDLPWGHALSLNNDATPNMTTAQATVLSPTSGSHETPAFDAVSTASSEGQHSASQSPSVERPLHCKTTAATTMDFNCQTQNDLRLPAVLGLRLGHNPDLRVSPRTSLLVSSGHLSGRVCGAATAVDDAGESTVCTGICEEGRDCLASVIESVRPSRGEGEAVDGETEPGAQHSMTSRTGRGAFALPHSPVGGGRAYRSSSMRVWRRVACGRGNESEGSGLRTYPSFTSPTIQEVSMGTSSAAAVEGKQTPCCEMVVPPATVDAYLHRFLSRTADLVSSKFVDHVDAADHTVREAAVVGADANDKAQAEGYGCLPSALPRALEDREEGGEYEPAEKTSATPERRGPESRRQRMQESLEMSRSSFLVSISYAEHELTCSDAGDETLTLTAQQAIEGAIREAQEEHQHAMDQTPEGTEKTPGAGLRLRLKGHDISCAGSEAQSEMRSDGEAATTTSTDVVLAAAAGEAGRMAQRFTHLSTGTSAPASTAMAKSTNAGFFGPRTHVGGGVGGDAILGGHVTPSSTSNSWTPSGTAPIGASAAASAMSATSITRPGNLGGALVSGGTNNTLQSSFDFPRTPAVHHDMKPSMVSDALSSGAVPFRSVATKVIEKVDLTRNAMKLNAFHNELRMASRLRHPCLVNMFGVAEDAKHFYLVMDLAEKGNLAQYQQRFGVRATREMAPQFTADVVLALEYLRDGSQHSYWVTPPPDSTDDSLLQDHRHCTSRTLGMRGSAGEASAAEPRGLPGSTSAHLLRQATESASAATVSKRLSLSAPTTPPLPSQHTGATDATDNVGADACSSVSAVRLVPRESMSESSESPLRTSSTAFGHEPPVPAHTATLPRQQDDNGRSVAQQDSIIVHRDLKPENLLLTWDFHVKLADFGDACFYGDNEANNFGGTPSYISPEVFARCKASPYSDLWALGCVLYELLVGERLFSGSLVEVGTAVQQFKPEALIFPDTLTSTMADSLTAKGRDARERGTGSAAGIAEAAKDLVRQLLQPVPEERLGSAERGGFDALKAHPFFADISWDKVLQTTNMTTTNTNYTAELAEYLEPTEAVVYCSPVKLLPTVEGSSSKEHLSTKSGGTNSRSTQIALVMALTDAPRLLLVNLDLHMVQFEIPWSTELCVSVLHTERFTVTVPFSDVLRSPSIPVPGSTLPPTTTAETSPMHSSSNFSAAAANTITYTFSDCNGRADLWGVKIHHLQSMCSAKLESGSAAGRSLPRLYSTPVVPTAGGAFHLPRSSASSQQLKHQRRRDTPTLSPRAGRRFLQWPRTTPRTMRAGSLGSLTISSNERSIGAPRDMRSTAATGTCAALSSDACGCTLSARITPATRTRATSSSHRISVSQSSAFTVSSAAAATPCTPSVMLHSSDMLQPPSLTGAALPSFHRGSATVTVTIASSNTSDSPRGSLNTWKANVGDSESVSSLKSPLEFDCTQSTACARPAAPPPLCSTASTSANTPGVSPTNTTAIPIGGEDSPQCGGNVSEARWNGYFLTPATSTCASTGALHPLSASATATYASGSVPESALGCSSSVGNVTPHLAFCSGPRCGGEGLLSNSFEVTHEALSQGEGTPGPWNTPTQADSTTGTPGTPGVLRLPSVCRDKEEGGAVGGGAPIIALAETAPAAAAAAAKLPIKRSQARQQYHGAQKMKSKPCSAAATSSTAEAALEKR